MTEVKKELPCCWAGILLKGSGSVGAICRAGQDASTKGDTPEPTWTLPMVLRYVTSSTCHMSMSIDTVTQLLVSQPDGLY